MKYIPVDKLNAEIERLRQGVINKWKVNPRSSMDDGFLTACSQFLTIITSFQQEQPKTDGDDGKFVKILVRKEFAEQLQRLGDELQAGQSSFIRAMNQQEQAEVDLWKEIHRYFNPNGMELQFDRSKGNTILKPEQLINFARHFYELGLNARKEK